MLSLYLRERRGEAGAQNKDCDCDGKEFALTGEAVTWAPWRAAGCDRQFASSVDVGQVARRC